MNDAADLKIDVTVHRPNLMRAWWPAAAWIAIIVVESSDSFSSQNTGSMLYALLTRIFGQINFYQFLVFHHYLRKTGHVIGYGMLSVLLLRGWRATLARDRVWAWRPTWLSWLSTAFVASMDEWHQTYIPSRTGSIWDVVLDSTAAIVFLTLAFFWLRRYRSNISSSIPQS